ncbi:WD repeat-containing protein [Echinococcus granulosus]|uniref:WD repeat-containing protein n=1 Tax=Echinococcus granulosus TaxID=6210 RepID=W6VCR1_ECHGR|nr:WD repeat-containing protein [Echinococcus granulosus]EUB64699.1 WD repeat-containing protein [Echinococcus granulosus]
MDRISQGTPLFSCGLDGKIIVSDIEDGHTLSKIIMRKPISRIAHSHNTYASLLGHGKSKYISISDISFQNGCRIFPGIEVEHLFDINEHFVAAVSNTKLYLHWFKFNDYTCYTFPVGEKSAAKAYKCLTCVACHPTEAIVATGNAMGEIMIWWNLTTTSSNLFNEMHVEGGEDGDDDSSGEDEADVGHFHAINKKFNSGWRLLHPKHVRRSGMHWHNFVVTALAFTGEGKHLYSGGIEGVLVKWDLTDCFGGIKNRRFLSMLNSPIQEISSPGGDSGDCAVVLLERNCFFIVNGAMQIIYKHMGLDQIPRRWRAFAARQSRALTALSLPNAEDAGTHDDCGHNNDDSTSASLLLSGALGGLQVVDPASAKILGSMDVNQRHYVVCDAVPSPLVSEVLLAEAWQDGEWVATYAELQLPRLPVPRPHLAGHSSDNQAQLVWWRRVRRRDQDAPSSGFEYEAVFGEPLAYLNCQATDLKFTRHPDGPQGFQTLLILRDQRVLVWQYNSVSDVQASQKPWKLTACIASNPDRIFYLEVKETVSPAPSKLCILNSDEESTGELMRSREEALAASKEKLRSIVVRATGLSLNSFMWIRWQSGSTVMEDMLPLDACHLPSWSDWKVGSFPDEVVEICQLAVLDPTKRLCVALLRPAFTTKSKRRDADGALCLLVVDPRGRLIPRTGVFDLAPTGAFAVDQTCGVVAVGLMNGSCVVYDANLQMVVTLPQLPLLPFCDRQRRNSDDGKQRKPAPTQPEALVFLPSKTKSATLPPLAAVIATGRGRDAGRRDLAVYSVKPFSASVESLPRSRTETTSLLARVERIDDDEMMEEEGSTPVGEHSLLPTHRLKSHLITDAELVRTLRRISQYPVDAAPPPEQLLAQLFRKPEL